MFKIELRASEPVIISRRQLTPEWKTFGTAGSKNSAEKETAWIINEIGGFLGDLPKSVGVEYRITNASGELVASNKV